MVDRKSLAVAVAGIILTLCGAAEAGLFGRRRSAVCPPGQCPTYQVSGGANSRLAYQVSGGGPAEFLAELNAWRAAHGRPPVAWDATLAAYAASNTGVHSPGSSGGAAQCWAGVSDMVLALRLWQASPPHRAILLHASVSVGASQCQSGVTCNAR